MTAVLPVDVGCLECTARRAREPCRRVNGEVTSQFVPGYAATALLRTSPMGSPAFHAHVAMDVAVQLRNPLGSGCLMEAVDVLGDHRGELAA